MRIFMTICLTVVVLITSAWLNQPFNSRQFEITKNLEIFANLYKELNTSYVDDLDPSKLMRIGIEAMLETLDPYTNYISESDIESYRYLSTGKYDGIGARLRKLGDFVTIMEPYEGGPSHEAGIMAGDQIIAVDGVSAEGKSQDQVNDILKGVPGSSVTITIRRPGQDDEFDLEVKRDEVAVKNVPVAQRLDGDIAYVALTTFTRNAGRNVAKGYEELMEDGPIKGMVLDLRNNGGGLLREAIQVSNVFIPKGELVVSTKGKVLENDRAYKTLSTHTDLETPLVVLINENSASASEIVSGVIQDLDRGVIVGQRSYGKGLVQNTVDLQYNSKLKLTTAKYYIPSGRCIQSISYDGDEPEDIPDSLRAEFATRNGRTVLDGGGITPDLKIDANRNIPILKYLNKNHLIFHFATDYRLRHESIPPPTEYTFDEFDQFVAFVQERNIDFKTDTEKLLNQLKRAAVKEKLHSNIEDDITAIGNSIDQEKSDDLFEYKDEISTLLEKEIVSRYYYQKGEVSKSLELDPEVKKAKEILRNQKEYNRLLANS